LVPASGPAFPKKIDVKSWPRSRRHAIRESMQFDRRLHEGIRRGQITCSVRIWIQPRVKVGGRYKLGDGEIEVDGIQAMSLEDITPALARRSGFQSVADMLKVAEHGRGENVYFVTFHYVKPVRRRR
jgi:hypothetical protein